MILRQVSSLDENTEHWAAEVPEDEVVKVCPPEFTDKISEHFLPGVGVVLGLKIKRD